MIEYQKMQQYQTFHIQSLGPVSTKVKKSDIDLFDSSTLIPGVYAGRRCCNDLARDLYNLVEKLAAEGPQTQ